MTDTNNSVVVKALGQASHVTQLNMVASWTRYAAYGPTSLFRTANQFTRMWLARALNISAGDILAVIVTKEYVVNAAQVIILCALCRPLLRSFKRWTLRAVEGESSWVWFLFKRNEEANAIRIAFQRTNVEQAKLSKTTAHPDARRNRTTAIDFAHCLASSLGMTPYARQLSTRNISELASHEHYCLHDATMRPRRDPLPVAPLFIHVDCSFQSESFEKSLLESPFTAPHVITEIYPTRPCYDGSSPNDRDYSYCFHQEGNDAVLVININGTTGQTPHKHKVIDFTTDFVAVSGWVKRTWKSISYYVRVYRIFHCDTQFSGTNQIIALLTPSVEYRGLAAHYAEARFGFGRFKYLNPIIKTEKGVFVAFSHFSDEHGQLTSVGSIGSMSSATVKSAYLDSMLDASRSTTQMMPKSNCSALMDKDLDPMVATQQLNTLTRYVRSVAESVAYERHTRRVVTSRGYVKGVIQSVVYTKDPVDEDDAKVNFSLIFNNPIISPVLQMSANAVNIRKGVEVRYASVAKSELTISRSTLRIMQFFVEYVVGADKGTLVPEDFEQVWHDRNRPTQRAAFETGAGENSPNVVRQCMQKKEIGEGVPRPVCPTAAINGMNCASLVAPVQRAITKQKWFCPGYTPAELAHKVSDMIHAARQTQVKLLSGDSEKQDGRFSNICHLLYRMIMFAYYPQQYHSFIRQMSDEDIAVLFHFGDGIVFLTYYTLASGSDITTFGNTVGVGFGAFLGFCTKKKPDGKYPSDAERMYYLENLLLVNGDDLICAGDPEAINRGAARMGLFYTFEDDRQTATMEFLARLWATDMPPGDPSGSMACPRRILPKFPTTSNSNIDRPVHTVMTEKAISTLYTDRDSYVIGKLCKKIVKLHEQEYGARATDKLYNECTTRDTSLSWWARVAHKLQSGFPQLDENVTEREYKIAYPEADFDTYMGLIDAARTLEDIRNLPTLYEEENIVPKYDALIDGEFYPGKNKMPAPLPDLQNQPFEAENSFQETALAELKRMQKIVETRRQIREKKGIYKRSLGTEEPSASTPNKRKGKEDKNDQRKTPTAKAPAQGGPEKICEQCGCTGHLARSCKKPKLPDNYVCRRCGKAGHHVRSCTKTPAKSAGATK